VSKIVMSRARFQFAQAMARGLKVADAAREAAINERTAYRYLRKPHFRKRVAELQHVYSMLAIGQVSEAIPEAAQALRGLLTSANESVRLRAIQCVFELSADLRHSADLENRIVEIEQQPAEGDAP